VFKKEHVSGIILPEILLLSVILTEALDFNRFPLGI